MGIYCVYFQTQYNAFFSILQRLIPDDWMLQYTICNAVDYKDNNEVNKYIVTIIKYILPFKLNPDGPGAAEPKKCPSFESCLSTASIKGASLNILRCLSPQININMLVRRVLYQQFFHQTTPIY